VNAYQQGVRAMERGQYRQAVLAFQTALADRPQDPQVKLWLVMAYEANQERQLARDLCRELTQHPDPQVRQQSQRVLYILEAPRLQRRSEWLNEIPLLTEATVPSLVSPRPKPKPSPPADLTPAPVTPDNAFIPVALVGVSLGLLLWAGWG